MAAEGVKLRSFYASPECTPTRAMLLTGRHTVHTGLQDSVIHGTEPRGVPLEEETLATRLRRRGYTTSCVGKWHLGFHQPQYPPRARGFDRFFGILNGGGNHYSHVTTEAFTTRGNARRRTPSPVAISGGTMRPWTKQALQPLRIRTRQLSTRAKPCVSSRADWRSAARFRSGRYSCISPIRFGSEPCLVFFPPR